MTGPASHDERLRQAERRLRESGSPDDEVAWLIERVRARDLTQERLELAAYCGHDGARRVAPTIAAPPSFEAWAKRIDTRWPFASTYGEILAKRLVAENIDAGRRVELEAEILETVSRGRSGWSSASLPLEHPFWFAAAWASQFITSSHLRPEIDHRLMSWALGYPVAATRDLGGG